ncbi:hypothetical protein CBL_09177 [Carabus blaptoides fortunei]
MVARIRMYLVARVICVLYCVFVNISPGNFKTSTTEKPRPHITVSHDSCTHIAYSLRYTKGIFVRFRPLIYGSFEVPVSIYSSFDVRTARISIPPKPILGPKVDGLSSPYLFPAIYQRV